MKRINPIDVFNWTFRRNEKDVVKLYDSLSNLMRITTNGKMLNFGYWDKTTTLPLQAQNNLCSNFGKFAQLESNQHVVDVGSGFCIPAFQWSQDYFPLNISCVNINNNQLQDAREYQKTSNENFSNKVSNKINFINSTATHLPFTDGSIDRLISLESAQHFKPFKDFLSESHRILKPDGLFALAIPVLTSSLKVPMTRLGILSMTWSSEHYDIGFIYSQIKSQGFQIIDQKKIGSNVYEPLADYYFKNRAILREKILKQYPAYVEKILFNSLKKMSNSSKNKILDYLLILVRK